jgi:hypothetical protein
MSQKQKEERNGGARIIAGGSSSRVAPNAHKKSERSKAMSLMKHTPQRQQLRG